MGRLARFAPGLAAILTYRFSDDLRYDAIAGLSVAAVALPVSIAYAQLGGFDPVVGLYSSILPPVAYAIFGTSRQLVVNPDPAVCAMIAAAVTPLAGNSAELYLSITTELTLLTGLFCIAASSDLLISDRCEWSGVIAKLFAESMRPTRKAG
jgi:MFS superfamily sulfate permease-like transporter